MITLRFGTSTNGLSGAHHPPTRPPLANAEPEQTHLVCCGWRAFRSVSGSHWAKPALFLERYITRSPLLPKRGSRVFYWVKSELQLLRSSRRRRSQEKRWLPAAAAKLRSLNRHCCHFITLRGRLFSWRLEARMIKGKSAKKDPHWFSISAVRKAQSGAIRFGGGCKLRGIVKDLINFCGLWNKSARLLLFMAVQRSMRIVMSLPVTVETV